jgi:predicted GNAT superfamily acetyltransferase
MINDYLKNKYISRVIKNTDLKEYNVPQLKILCKFNNLYYKCKARRNELEDILAEKIKSCKKEKFKPIDLSSYTVIDLKEICDTYKINYYSNVKKDEIINQIIKDDRIIKYC